jgi:hypothetical protein
MPRRVNIEPRVAHEAEQSQPARFGEFDGETRGGSDGRKYRDASPCRLLNQFETGASANEEDPILERDTAGEPFRSNHLIHRVMASDILANRVEFAHGIEERGSMQSTGMRENLLSAS